MKFSDLMLDYATGDACPQDAYIQEAMGQINVSKAMYDAAVEIMDLDRDEISYIQEAATAAGLPTGRKDALDLAQEAFSRSARGFLNLVKQTNSKLATAADKSWQTICGAAKITRVPSNLRDEDLDKFAYETASRIVQKADNDGTPMSRGFKNGTSLRTNAALFMKSIQDVLPGFGMKGDKGSNVIREYVSLSDTDYADGDLNKFIVTLEYATASLAQPVQESYGAAGVADIADYIKTSYNLRNFCGGVDNALSESATVSGGAYAAQNAGNGIRSQEAMAQMQRSARRIVSSANTLAKSLNDSGYAVGEALNRGSAPLPQKKEMA